MRLDEIVAAWIAEDLTLAGYAAADAFIESPWEGVEMDLSYDQHCQIGSSGAGGCTIFGYDGTDGYALLWNILYHEDQAGRLVVDQIAFEGSAG